MCVVVGVQATAPAFLMCNLKKKTMICHTQLGHMPDLLATSGDYLRLWRVNDSDIRQECMLNNVSELSAV